MVRINIIEPELLSDQHLIAEKNEIGMLFGYVRKYPEIKEEEIPKEYTLNYGHMKFFKNKLGYLSKREKSIRIEMKRRNFKCGRELDLSIYSKKHMGQWKPKKKDYNIIIKRISERLMKKPSWYRYCSVYLGKKNTVKMVKSMRNLYL